MRTFSENPCKVEVLKKHILSLLLLAILVKILYAVAGYYWLPSQDKGLNQVLQLQQRNDSEWYKQIALHGYPRVEDARELGYSDSNNVKQSAWAFFPLYPAVNRATMELFSCSYDAAATATGFLFSLLLFVGFYLLARSRLGDAKAAFQATSIFIVFPFHYYFSMHYTESLYLMLLIYAFLCIEWRGYAVLFVLLFLLPLSRPNGLVVALPLFVFMLEKEGLLQGFRLKINAVFQWEFIKKALPFLAVPLAWILYAWYQHELTGEYFAFSKAQAGWNKKFMFPLLSLFREGDWRMQFNSAYTVVAMLLTFYLYRRSSVSEQIYLWLGFLLPLLTGSVLSMPRFISALFPLFIVPFTAGPMNKTKFVLVAGLCVVLQLLTFYFWVIGDSFSY